MEICTHRIKRACSDQSNEPENPDDPDDPDDLDDFDDLDVDYIFLHNFL